MALDAMTFLALVIGIGLVKTEIVKTILHASHRISGKPHIGIWLYAILFFPGTVLHELSHFFMAIVLGVRTNDMHLLPKREEGYVQLGYVTVAKTDILRSFFIGVAPFAVGLTAVCLLAWTQWHAVALNPLTASGLLVTLRHLVYQPLTWAVFYLLIVFSHAMFLSEADRREIYLLPVTVFLIGVVAYVFRNQIHIPASLVQLTEQLLLLVDILLGLVLAFNLAFLLVIAALKKVLETLF